MLAFHISGYVNNNPYSPYSFSKVPGGGEAHPKKRNWNIVLWSNKGEDGTGEIKRRVGDEGKKRIWRGTTNTTGFEKNYKNLLL